MSRRHVGPATVPLVRDGVTLPAVIALYRSTPPRVFATERGRPVRELSVRVLWSTPVVRVTVDGRQVSLSLARAARAWVCRGPAGRALAWNIAEGVAGLRWRDDAATILRVGGRFAGRVRADGVRAKLNAVARRCVEENERDPRALHPSARRIMIADPPPDTRCRSRAKSSRTGAGGGS